MRGAVLPRTGPAGGGGLAGARPGSRAPGTPAPPPPRPKRREVSRIVLREPPGPWALREELHRVGADGGRVVERALDPARAVAAEEHGPTLTGARVPRPGRFAATQVYTYIRRLCR